MLKLPITGYGHSGTQVMIASWQKLAQEGTGPKLIHQIASAFFTEADWPFMALAHRTGAKVKVLVASNHGIPSENFEYDLLTSPCQLLYRDKVLTPLFLERLDRFSSWPLYEQLKQGCYSAIRLPLTEQIGDFHLVMLDPKPRHSDNLPVQMMQTAANRVAEDLAQQKVRFELAALKEIQHRSTLASAIVNHQLRLKYVSSGLATLFQVTPEQLNGELLAQIAQWHSPLPLPTAGQAHRTSARASLSTGESIEMELQFEPLEHGHQLIVQPYKDSAAVTPNAILSETNVLNSLDNELARIKRNGNVAALLFISFDGLQSFSKDLAKHLQNQFRKDDQIGLLDSGNLVVLTACFDHSGQTPRHQMETIAGKLTQKIKDWQSEQGREHSFSIRLRIVTSWDDDPIDLLNIANAVQYQRPNTSGTVPPFSSSKTTVMLGS